MEEGYRYGQMGQGMMVFGKMGWLMVEAGWSMKMGMYTKESGLMIKLMDMAYNKIIMEADMKGAGKTINNMVMELRNGLMGLPMKVNTKTV